MKTLIPLLFISSLYAGIGSSKPQKNSEESTRLLTKSDTSRTLTNTKTISIDEYEKITSCNSITSLRNMGLLDHTIIWGFDNDKNFILTIDTSLRNPEAASNTTTINITGNFYTGYHLDDEYEFKQCEYEIKDNMKYLKILMENKKKENDQLNVLIKFERKLVATPDVR